MHRNGETMTFPLRIDRVAISRVQEIDFATVPFGATFSPLTKSIFADVAVPPSPSVPSMAAPFPPAIVKTAFGCTTSGCGPAV